MKTYGKGMKTVSEPESDVHLVVSLDELARALGALKRNQFEQLELAFSPQEETEIYQRKSAMTDIIARDEHITLDDLKDEIV